MERPSAEQLLHHPWVLQSSSIITSPITPQVRRRSNSTILNNYLQKKISQDDLDINIIPRGSSSMKVTLPSSSNNNNFVLPPPPQPLPQHQGTSPSLPTIQSKSLFVNKFHQQRQQQHNGAGALLARQSMPAIVVAAANQAKQQESSLPHVHNLIECSFPKGKVVIYDKIAF